MNPLEVLGLALVSTGIAALVWILASQLPIAVLAALLLFAFLFIGTLVAEYFGWTSKSLSKFLKGG